MAKIIKLTESLSKRERLMQNTLETNNGLVSELLKESVGKPKKVSYDVMVQKLRNAKSMGEWSLVDEVISDLITYDTKPPIDNITPTGNRNTWPFK